MKVSSRFYNYWKLLRPRHWVKNFFIFAPLVFSGKIASIDATLLGARLFISFSFLASSVYIFNDLLDKDYDKRHPQKRNRPIASGRCPSREAVLLAIVLLGAVLWLSLQFPAKTLIALSAYIVTNLLYSFWLKNIIIVDIFLVASFYLLRVLAGGGLWGIPISHWLILCTFFLSLFLASAKRRSEFCDISNEKPSTRKVIQFYNKDFLDHLLTITTTASLVAYSLYVVSVSKPYLLYSLFLVAFGFFRYLYLVYRYNLGQSPESVLFADKWILFTVLGWSIYTSFIFYLF